MKVLMCGFLLYLHTERSMFWNSLFQAANIYRVNIYAFGGLLNEKNVANFEIEMLKAK